MCFARHKKHKHRRTQSLGDEPKDESKTSQSSKKEDKNEGVEAKAPKDENSSKMNDETGKKMSVENTLKEVPNRMPEVEFVHPQVTETVYSEDQLL